MEHRSRDSGLCPSRFSLHVCRLLLHVVSFKFGGPRGHRTPDLAGKNRLLCHLSYEPMSKTLSFLVPNAPKMPAFAFVLGFVCRQLGVTVGTYHPKVFQIVVLRVSINVIHDERSVCGATDENRTHNLPLTRRLLCQLSYGGAYLLLQTWWAHSDSNRESSGYEPGALTNCAIGPEIFHFSLYSSRRASRSASPLSPS